MCAPCTFLCACSPQIVDVAGKAMQDNFTALGPHVLPLSEQIPTIKVSQQTLHFANKPKKNVTAIVSTSSRKFCWR